MAFRVGQEVTMKEPHRWVDNYPGYGGPAPSSFPQFGEVYRVEAKCSRDGLRYLRLDGIPAWFWAEHFRPVVKPTTNISIFTRMLDEASSPATRSPELVT